MLLLAIVLYAVLRGGKDERIVGIICVVGTLVTTLVISPTSARFEGLETQVLYVDLAVLAGFVAVALQSDRFWPLWVAGLQLTTVLGHLLKGVESDLIPQAYGAALNFWSYPILLILAGGTWRAHRRRRKETDRSLTTP
ncbi:hypothetical protein G7077_05015 [Sphingomonas piscis]|uniref:Uncharacterized protein n=1 Tax=Sphingomonas piscis TaxID=2714943 RepID=A0A6G7YNP3_9SPHN|nr:hypothetical protein [Sphingomonas piscis]QIK78359.1 hypothetical protein G7077_05015 [Sphingomonas piscis]